MTDRPASPDLSHLKKQAKHLLRDARAGDAQAIRRVLATLPAARGLAPDALAGYELRLHDAQSIIAREAGFPSWTGLKRHVAWTRAGRADRLKTWLRWSLEGNARERGLALRTLRDEPTLLAGLTAAACVLGDEAAVATALRRDPSWVNRPEGPFGMPPLVAVTHSRLILEHGFEPRLLACAALLLRHGADVDGTWVDPRWPESPLSALYGAAGRTHSASMTALLLAAGANPDDNESLYHSVEARDGACTRLLLDAGARVTGTNSIGRVLDFDKPDQLRLLLRHGGDASERPWIHHAILRGRSRAHVVALLEAGADPRAVNADGVTLFAYAAIYGRADVLDLLRAAGVEEPLSEPERFLAACTRGDETEARAIAAERPDIVSRLAPAQLQVMPVLAGMGGLHAVQTMLTLGWPVEVKTGWDASALNHAVFQGDAEMARILLEHGADWRTMQGFGDNVLGTLSFASLADDIDNPGPRDYAGCARLLAAQDIPPAEWGRYVFSPEVTDCLDLPLSGAG